MNSGTLPIADEEISLGREVWIRHICAKADSELVRAAVGPRPDAQTTDRPSLEVAMLAAHAGLGHLLGYQSDDIAIPDWFSTDRVGDVIARVWRTGQMDPDLSRFPVAVWQTFHRLGSDTRRLEPDLLERLASSTIGRWVTAQASDGIAWHTAGENIAKEIADSQITPIELSVAAEYPTSRFLDVEGSHIPALRLWAFRKGVGEVSGIATPLELLACYEETSDEERQREWLRQTRAVQHVYMSMPGSWPGPNEFDVPEWVREWVLGRGGRMATTTSGHAPGLLLVAESDEEVDAFRAWTYSPTFALARNEGSRVSIGLALPFKDPDEIGNAWYYYWCEDVTDRNRLQTMLAMAMIRIDLYRISSESQLVYVDSVGVPLDADFVDRVRQLLDDATAADAPSMPDLVEYTADEWLQMMASLDGSSFESLHLCHRALVDDPSSRLASAYAQHLTVIQSCASAVARGALPDLELFRETYQSVRNEVGRSVRAPGPTLDLDLLGPRRAYVQLRVTHEEGYLLGFVAYVDPSSNAQVERLDFSSSLDLFALPDDLSGAAAVLTDGLSDLSDLLGKGVESLVVNMSSGIYNLPVHEAILRLGFSEVSYSHRLSSLAPRLGAEESTLRILGWADEGGSHLQSVERELAAVASLYKHKIIDGDALAVLPKVVHLAGHATTGVRPFDVALNFAAGEVLTPARILLEVDARNSEVVVLSACSTGVALFRPRQISDSPPLDVAMIEVGARTVLATAAPINDVIAGVFSCAFHYAYAEMEYEVWPSYVFARDEASATAAHAGFADWLDQYWPGWKSEFGNARVLAPDDWMLFRLSGRLW